MRTDLKLVIMDFLKYTIFMLVVVLIKDILDFGYNGLIPHIKGNISEAIFQLILIIGFGIAIALSRQGKVSEKGKK